LKRRRFQTGYVRLRKDRSPAYWAGFYREDVVTEAGKTERKRRYVNLGLLKDVPSERAARQKLAVILEPINDFSQSSKMRITFREFIEKTVVKERRTFDWHEPEHDPEGLYSVDCRIEVPADDPIFIYALQSDDKVKDATIGLHQYERWAIRNRGVGVFENQEDINRRSLARFSDVCDKQFSNLATNKERLAKYLSGAGVVH